MLFKAFSRFVTLSLLAVLAGCASYQMGDPGKREYSRVSIARVSNQTSLPQLEGSVVSALRKNILQSGSLSLASENKADAIIYVDVVELRRDTVAAQSEDVGRGRKFELGLDCILSVEDANNRGQYFSQNQALSITQNVYNDSGLVDAEYQATPEIAEKIAAEVLNTLLNTWDD